MMFMSGRPPGGRTQACGKTTRESIGCFSYRVVFFYTTGGVPIASPPEWGGFEFPRQPSGKPRCRPAGTLRRHKPPWASSWNVFGSPPRLHAGELSVRCNAFDERGPGFAHSGFVCRAIEQPLIDPPCRSVVVETRSAGFLERINCQIQQAGTSQAISLLTGQDTRIASSLRPVRGPVPVRIGELPVGHALLAVRIACGATVPDNGGPEGTGTDTSSIPAPGISGTAHRPMAIVSPREQPF